MRYAAQAGRLRWTPSDALAYTKGRPLNVNILAPLDGSPLHLQAVRLMAGTPYTSTHSYNTRCSVS